MNTTFKTKFLLHINQKKQASGEQGFTLIELLVVIIIIGILAAIALPSFLNQANKGRQAEGKQYVSSINKGQQAYYTENGSFVTETTPAAWGSLGVGIKTQTANYKYEIKNEPANGVSVWATKIPTALRSYSGTVGLIGGNNQDKTSLAVVCETKTAADSPKSGNVTNDGVNCNDMNPI
ncbi:type IV pilin-like G/H family protein [Aerosakkonemataceae cyanobacterium BLCC-F50]|uniref:Type IV pilin-like G/H family protein n=1 Tax=Floridaenema flaviceps BLCC-F50 TaxID=3153642 RepID=A0ABV4Y4U1_9CYAN